MRNWITHLGRLGPIDCFDYPYQLAGRRAPDAQPKLISAHREAFERARGGSAEQVVLVGKSMGGRIGCHVAVELGEAGPPALVCLGYPLVGSGKVRDQVLLALRAPILFVQGTRDPMCPRDTFEQVSRRMQARHQVHWVEGGDHSLVVSPARLRAANCSQSDVFDGVVEAISSFTNSL
jgi:predicted alpha/beta-hydrolase family hydrolase